MKAFEELTYLGQVRRLRRLAEHALAERAFEWDRLDFLVHGENTTFRVRRGDENWLLRIHRNGYQSDDAIRSELMWLRALVDAGLPVPRPVAGLQTVTLEGLGARRVVLFAWTHGRFARRLKPRHLEQVGALTARFHEASMGWKSPAGFTRSRLDLDGLVGDTPVMGGGLHLVPDDLRPVFEDCRDAAVERAREVWIEGENVCLIHADLHHGNYLFPDSEHAAAIDFDDCGYGHVLYDLAVTLGAVGRGADAEALHRAYLRGYRSVRGLPDALVAYLPVFRALRALTIAFWVYGRTDNPFFVERAREQGPRIAALLAALRGEFPV